MRSLDAICETFAPGAVEQGVPDAVLDAIGRLRVTPCPDSDTPVGSCFEADGKVIRFPR